MGRTAGQHNRNGNVDTEACETIRRTSLTQDRIKEIKRIQHPTGKKLANATCRCVVVRVQGVYIGSVLHQK